MHETETSAGLSPDQKTLIYQPGTVVRVTQQIPRRTDTYVTVISGTVIRQERQSSGSWYARNKGQHVWLDRLIIQKDDGEISILNLDEYSLVEVIQGSAGTKGDSPMTITSEDMTAGMT